jgi:hypothetical protein
MNTLKRNAPEKSLAARRNLFEMAGKECQKREPEIVYWLINYETSKYKHQIIRRSLKYVRAYYEGQGQKHLKDQA